MEATLNLSIDNFSVDFVEKIKNMFDKNSVIEIKISEMQDETDYLFSTTENKEALERSLQQIQQNVYIHKTIEELTA